MTGTFKFSLFRRECVGLPGLKPRFFKAAYARPIRFRSGQAAEGRPRRLAGSDPELVGDYDHHKQDVES